MKRKILAIVVLSAIVLCFQACEEYDLIAIDNNIEPLPKLSDYKIFNGNPSNLVPTEDFKLYELSTELFTDYAEKQRLIKIPQGTVIKPAGDGLPEFPDGTIIAKTFYYYNDKRDTAKGKNIIETRVMIKSDSKWNVANYLWNDEQTEAELITSGSSKTVNWIDKTGGNRVVSYQVPGKNECTTCHQISRETQPIGPKMRNLNVNVIRGGRSINQLEYFMKLKMMNSDSPTSYGVLPDWEDTKYSLEQRSRAYLEVNCAHCHNSGGFAAQEKLYLGYDIPLEGSNIVKRKRAIANNIANGDMPRIGTTIVHDEALEVLKSYLNNL